MKYVLPMFLLLAGPVYAHTWQVDHDQSQLGVQVMVNDEHVDGQFKTWDADIQFDPKSPASCIISVNIAMDSFDTGNGTRDGIAKGAEMFHVKQFPNAAYVAKRCVAQTGGGYVAVGALYLRGVTQPLRLPFTLDIQGDIAHMSGSVTINRLDFGVGQGEWQKTDSVAEQVAILPKMVARRVSKPQ